MAACAAPEEALLPRETFRWTEQPIAFAPPPEGWRREGELSGGVKGVRFVKERSVGEAITIGELHDVAARDRTKAIEKLIERYDEPKFLREAQLAQMRTDLPYYSEHEARVAEEVNAALQRARTAHFRGDHAAAKQELENALAASRELQFTLDEVRPKRRPAELPLPKDLTRRELYLIHRNHLFTARFIGRHESLPVFERVVASIEFPP